MIKKFIIFPVALLGIFTLCSCATLSTFLPYAITTAEVIWQVYKDNPELRELINGWFNIDGVAGAENSSEPANYSNFEDWYSSLDRDELERMLVLERIIHQNNTEEYDAAKNILKNGYEGRVE